MPIDTVVNNLKTYSKFTKPEKVHLHFDKPFYAPGDTIWFEGYVVNALQNIPSDRSKILYVDLIAAGGSIQKSLQLPLNVGFAAGELAVDDNLPVGNYRIRAYTKWMLNWGPDYFFQKDISIISAVSSKGVALKSGSHRTQARPAGIQYDIQLFPESGNLVNGIQSAVAFKVVSDLGYGVSVKGTLVDQDNNEILNFKSRHAGMGSFTFMPVSGKSYTALVELPDGQKQKVLLPKAQPSGYVITSDNSNPDSLTITLFATPDLLNKQELILLPISNGVPLFVFRTKFPDKRINITAPRNKLPPGILQLTLFNAAGTPTAERLVFNNYVKKISLNTSDIRPSYTKREKTQLSLIATDYNGLPLIGSFSMSVTNEDQVLQNEEQEMSIFSDLLLKSDLKGFVETPNYYFVNPSPLKDRDLDILMLTQGWTRYAWTDITTGKFPAIQYQPDEDFTISGKVLGAKNQPVANAKVSLITEKLGGGIMDTVTDLGGGFSFKIPEQQIFNKFMLQVAQQKEQNSFIKLDTFHPLPAEPFKVPADSIRDAAQSMNTNSAAGGKSLFNKSTKLKEVIIKDYTHKNKLEDSHSANLNGAGNADIVLTSKDLENCIDLSCLTSLLPLRANVLSNLGTHTGNMLILLDGMAVSGDGQYTHWKRL